MWGAYIVCMYICIRASLVAQRVEHLPAMWETQVRSLGQEDPLEQEMATHCSSRTWKVPWTEEPGEIGRASCRERVSVAV